MPAAEQLALDLPAGSSPSLGNFVPGANAEVLAVLNHWAAGGLAPQLLYLWGQPGSGKSHLAQASAAALAPASRHLTPHSPLSEFAPEPQAGAGSAATAAHASGNRLDRRLNQNPGLGSIVVDDADRLDAARQQALFGLINRVRADPAARLLCTGAAPPLALTLREDLRSRLGWGLVFELSPLADRDKALALQALASERGVMMSAEVVPYLLTHTSRDMRQLIGLFDALDRLSLQRQRAITVPLVRDLLQVPPPNK